MRPVVTFDLFSALVDSRAGGSAVFAELGTRRGWPLSGAEVYDAWDGLNKAAQRDCQSWVPYATLAEDALARAYGQLGVDGDPPGDLAMLLASLPRWPLWPDVSTGLSALSRRHPIGLLSNVDDAMFSRTRAAQFFEPEHVFTSQRLGVYKPDPRIYERARAQCGSLVHVATSARDVRGALEAGIRVIRLRRPGHRLDTEGPEPTHQAASLAELAELLAEDPWRE